MLPATMRALWLARRMRRVNTQSRVKSTDYEKGAHDACAMALRSFVQASTVLAVLTTTYKLGAMSNDKPPVIKREVQTVYVDRPRNVVRYVERIKTVAGANCHLPGFTK